MKINFSFQEHFGLSRKERIGYTVFACGLLLITLGIEWQKLIRQSPEWPVSDGDLERSSQDTASLDTGTTLEVRSISFSTFDPNTCPESTWLGFGVPNYLAKRILKFRKAGGRFHQPNDLYKIYGMDSNLIKAMLPFVSIKTTKSKQRRAGKKKSERRSKIVKINVNTADSAKLTKLWGVGPVYAKRIVKYRKLLGGFYSIQQIREVYGFSDSLLNSLTNHIECSGPITHLEINSIESGSLARHPYCTYAMAKQIISYRKMHTMIESADQLHRLAGIDKSKLKKLLPYLAFN
jgi:competence ComEA-like helix-hairpin-helix protein